MDWKWDQKLNIKSLEGVGLENQFRLENQMCKDKFKTIPAKILANNKYSLAFSNKPYKIDMQWLMLN